MAKRVLFDWVMIVTAGILWGGEPFSGPKNVAAVRLDGTLPATAGQYWMEYDITPYTSRYPALPHPEQTLINWIIYDTGETFWHGEPFCVLSADKQALRVYHNDKVQQYISNVLDRFLDPAKKNELFSVQIISVGTPDWRTKAAAWIRPYPSNSPGISCWTLDLAGYQALSQSLAKRSDYLQLNASRNIVPNTETFGWVLPSPKREYIRDIQLSNASSQGYVSDTTSIDEGYRIEVTPLLSTNGDLIEFYFSCQSTVIEKMHSFQLKVPTSESPRQQLSGETPQIASREMKDKISFPKDRVLLIDLGMVPMPKQKAEDSGLSKLFGGENCWQNLLIFVQADSVSSPIPPPAQTTPTTIPVPAPVQTPTPAQTPAPAPAQVSAQTSVQTPAQFPAQTPVQTPAQLSAPAVENPPAALPVEELPPNL